MGFLSKIMKPILMVVPGGALIYKIVDLDTVFNVTEDALKGGNGNDNGNGGDGGGDGDGTIIDIPLDVEVPSFWDYLAEYLSDPVVVGSIMLLILGVGWWARGRRKKLANQIRGKV